ncbi:MAG: RNase adapter RapZ [Bacteroidales bacterium]
MMEDTNAIRNLVETFYREHTGKAPEEITATGSSASHRRYFRITSGNTSMIGVFNEDTAENEAFFYLTGHFHRHGLSVPEIKGIHRSRRIYLLEDLGDTSLYSLVSQGKPGKGFDSMLTTMYGRVIDQLPRFQILAGRDLDYSRCHPVANFDVRSMKWDMNYFKYYFIKLNALRFNEHKLENDFHTLGSHLSEAPADFFMYRDFQSRNIMIHNNKPHFIDYQGGRKGPLQYDIVSLLYQVKAGIPENIRQDLLRYYLKQLRSYGYEREDEFMHYFPGFLLLRVMQVFGTYGFRGLYEKKPYFLESIPLAIASLRDILQKWDMKPELPELGSVFDQILEKKEAPGPRQSCLHVQIESFSYKKGLPEDTSGHGGGFVFDCRPLPNPGRYQQYAGFDGRDRRVIDHLQSRSETGRFLQNVYDLAEQATRNYISRGFEHLSISFGCTGGQHRSVYCAEKTALFLKQNFPVSVSVRHREMEKG